MRFAFVAYINLARVIKQNGIDGSNAMEVLERAIIDIKLREKIINETKKIFDLMSEPKKEKG